MNTNDIELLCELASTNINICSIYSAMDKHDISLTYAEKANMLCEETISKIASDGKIYKEREEEVEAVATVLCTS